jgi:hypothetical protein
MKEAIENAKKHVHHIQDKFPIDDMYVEVKARSKSKHGLSVWVSKRGESKLEGSHAPLAHYANTGTREESADHLNLAGTARYNKKVRHKYGLNQQDSDFWDGKFGPNYYAEMVPFWDDSELTYLNGLATSLGMEVPFPGARPLPKDNKERFFSEYFWEQVERKGKYPHPMSDGTCPCLSCQSKLERKAQEANVGATQSSKYTCNYGTVSGDRKRKPLALQSSPVTKKPRKKPRQDSVELPIVFPPDNTLSSPPPRSLGKGTSKNTRNIPPQPNQMCSTHQLGPNVLPTNMFPMQQFLQQMTQQSELTQPLFFQVPQQYSRSTMLQHHPCPIGTPTLPFIIPPVRQYCCRQLEEYVQYKRKGKPAHAKDCPTKGNGIISV